MGAVTRPTDPAPIAGPERRSVLLLGAGVGAGLLALSGCTLNNPYSSETTPATEAVRDLAPDVGIAVQAVVRIRTQANLLDSSVRAVPSLTGRFDGLRQLHRAHLEALVSAVPKRVDTSAPGATLATGADRLGTLRRVKAGEQALHAQLTGYALRAESGAFARLLGSMAAAISQQLEVL